MGQVSQLEDIQKRLDEAAHQIDLLSVGLTKEELSPLEQRVLGIGNQVREAIGLVQLDLARIHNYSVLRGTPDYSRYLEARAIEEELTAAQAMVKKLQGLVRKMKAREAKLVQIVNSLHVKVSQTPAGKDMSKSYGTRK